MKIKSFLIMVLSLISLTVAAQNGGIKGKVVSRATRTAIDGVKVTLTPGNVTTTTDEKGNFIFENLNKVNIHWLLKRQNMSHCPLRSE